MPELGISGAGSADWSNVGGTSKPPFDVVFDWASRMMSGSSMSQEVKKDLPGLLYEYNAGTVDDKLLRLMDRYAAPDYRADDSNPTMNWANEVLRHGGHYELLPDMTEKFVPLSNEDRAWITQSLDAAESANPKTARDGLCDLLLKQYMVMYPHH
jgi:hypothetical protein